MFTEFERLHGALTAYIEANYHISHPDLVELRRSTLGSLEIAVLAETEGFEPSIQFPV